MDEPNELGARCAHLIYHSDNADKLREILLEVGDPLAVLTFPSSTIPNSDRTFLMACARRGRYECCKLLLSLDSAGSINQQNSQGYTALHYASYEGHADVAFLLLSAGASTEIRNSHNETAYQTAISGKRVDLVRMYQQSHYFANCLSEAILPHGGAVESGCTLPGLPPGGINTNTTTIPSSSIIRLNRHEAASFLLHITEVGPGTDHSLVGCEFACLSSVQQQANRTAPTVLSGSVHNAAGRMDGSSEDLYIGRARTNHVCLGDLSISKQHAVISYVEDLGFVVHDVGSKHGTFIDEKRLPIEQDALPAMEVDNKVGSGGKNNTEAGKKEANTDRMLLKEGTMVRFGRITCTVVRRRQEAVLSGRFQPATQATSTAAVTAQDTARRHEAAVQERVRVLLNLPHSVAIPGPSVASKAGTVSHDQTKKDSKTRKRQEQNNYNTSPVPFAPTSEAGEGGNVAKAAKISYGVEGRRTDETGDSGPLPEAVGLTLLQKYGWQQGVALGKHGGAANAPIEVYKKQDNSGIGAYQPAGGQESVTGKGADSEKMKAWKRMMARYNEQR